MKPPKIITEEEYSKLISTLQHEISIKNTLLTFSFTAVLAILGLALSEKTSIHPAAFLVPFFLIVPFAARISYYRVVSAHINTFLKVFAPERMIYPIGTEMVPEKSTSSYFLIAWLVNHEMVLLSAATTMIFWFMYFPQVSEWTVRNVLLSIFPLFLDGFVFWLSDSTYSYKKLCEVYKPQWETYLQDVMINAQIENT